MITPLDIQNQEFAKGVRGYREDEVDAFLDLITIDYEKLLTDNSNLKEQVKNLSSELARYRNTESMVLETLEAAKALMGDISASAEKRAEILVKNAELDADRITREAREAAERLHDENTNLRNRLNVFRTRYKTLLESELEKFDTLSAELFADRDIDDLKNILESRTMKVNTDKNDEDIVDFTDKTIFNFRPGSDQ
ncbi:DivIVA domain-containing protein [Bacillota bacterium]